MISMSVFFIFMLTSCSTIRNLSPMEVLKNSIEQPNQIQYYGESTMKVKFLEDETSEEIIVKEWRKDELQRMEMDDGENYSTSITDGDQTLSYSEDEEIAYLFKDKIDAYGLMQPKEEMDSLLSHLFESHDMELIGDEHIAKRKTFHLQAQPKEENKEEASYEIWVDKQYWTILKMETISEQVEIVTTFQHIEYNPKFPEDIFSMDPPDDYALKEVDADEDTEVVTAEELEEVYENDIIFMADNEEFTLNEIKYSEFQMSDDEEPFIEVTFDYVKDGSPYFTLTIFEASEEPEDLPFEDEETIQIRGQDVSFVDDVGFVSWREDGHLYMIDYFDPNIEKENIEKWTGEMIHLHDK